MKILGPFKGSYEDIQEYYLQTMESHGKTDGRDTEMETLGPLKGHMRIHRNIISKMENRLEKKMEMNWTLRS